MTTQMKHINIRVFGRVQFVGFRAYTQKAAQELGITGFVKNMPDGTVYIESEGNDTTLAAFTDWCKKGSPWARVDRIEVTVGTLGGFMEFRVVKGTKG